MATYWRAIISGCREMRSGNANRQVVNTSGNIETQKGDITVKTASLLNHREGLTATTTENVASAEPKIAVNIDDMPEGSVGVYYDSRTFHGGGGCAEGLCITYYKFYYAPFEDYLSRKFILSESATHVTSQGGGTNCLWTRYQHKCRVIGIMKPALFC
jgi:filamentous hemagglutinin